MDDLHRELDQMGGSGVLQIPGTYGAAASQPMPLGGKYGGRAATMGGSQPVQSHRESLGLIELDKIPLFKSRVAANPLATLNSRCVISSLHASYFPCCFLCVISSLHAASHSVDSK